MKKKFMSILLSIVVALSLVNVGYADSGITVRLDGKPLTFDVQPQLIGGRTMVPLRVIFESLGATVEWDDSTKTVTAYNEFYIVNATIGSNIMTVNGEQRQIDVPPMIVESRTLVPARFVAEAFNCNVEWDGNSKTVYITSGDNDYSQVEKDTGNVNTQGTTVNTSNSEYDKLKNFLVTEGEKSYVDGGTIYQWYYFDPQDDRYGILMGYRPEEGEILITFMYEGSMTDKILIKIVPNEIPRMVYGAEFDSGEQYILIASFPDPYDTFEVESNEIPQYMWELTFKKINMELNIIDIALYRNVGVELSDFGIYYEEYTTK